MQEDHTKKREGVFLSGGWYPDAHCDLILLCAGTYNRTCWYGAS